MQFIKNYSGYGEELAKGVLNNVFEKFLCLIIVSSNWAFIAGSSKHGKTLRASLGSNCVIAKLNL